MKKFLLLISFVMLASVAGAQSLPTYVNAERVTPYAQTDMCLHNAMPVAVDMAGGGSSSAAASLAGVPLVRFQSYLNVGAVFQEKSGGPTVDISFGARVGRCFYAGIETGFGCVIESVELVDHKITFNSAYVPVALNLKGYIPLGPVRPYLNCSLGGFFGVMDLEGLNGFYCQAGAGIDIFRFSLGVGYCGLVKESTANMGYVKLGVRFGGGR